MESIAAEPPIRFGKGSAFAPDQGHTHPPPLGQLSPTRPGLVRESPPRPAGPGALSGMEPRPRRPRAWRGLQRHAPPREAAPPPGMYVIHTHPNEERVRAVPTHRTALETSLRTPPVLARTQINPRLQRARRTILFYLILFFFPFSATKPGFATHCQSSHTVCPCSPISLGKGDNGEAGGQDAFRAGFAASRIATLLTLPVLPCRGTIRQARGNCLWKNWLRQNFPLPPSSAQSQWSPFFTLIQKWNTKGSARSDHAAFCSPPKSMFMGSITKQGCSGGKGPWEVSSLLLKAGSTLTSCEIVQGLVQFGLENLLEMLWVICRVLIILMDLLFFKILSENPISVCNHRPLEPGSIFSLTSPQVGAGFYKVSLQSCLFSRLKKPLSLSLFQSKCSRPLAIRKPSNLVVSHYVLLLFYRN